MLRIDAMKAVYPRLKESIVITIMGAVSAELQSLGHQPNFFYLQHAMGLASAVPSYRSLYSTAMALYS